MKTSADAAEIGDLERDSAPIPMMRPRRAVREDVPFDGVRREQPVDADEAAGVPRSLTRRDVRRFVIRLIGFAALGAVIYGAVYIAREPRARGEIAAWGTLGNPRIAATAGRGVRSVVDTVRSFGK